MNDITKRLHDMSVVPPWGSAAFDTWLEQKDALTFLNENLTDSKFVLYAALPNIFMHAVLVPNSLVNPPDFDDLMSWNCDPYSSWGTSYQFSDPPVVSISPPLEGAGSETISGGEQLVFMREFEGRIGQKSYVEALQKLTYLLGLHYLYEKGAYCRLDKHGDIEPVIRIVRIPQSGDHYGGIIVTIHRQSLDEYATLTDSAIVRMFDFTRIHLSHFGGWSDNRNEQVIAGNNLCYRLFIEPKYASVMRGCQVAHSNDSKENIYKRFWAGDSEKKQYASFIAQDWKNQVIAEISCDPSQLANYFTESKLPFEISPAFFRPEVLQKYKTDPEKYRLGERSVSCRGAWGLETYDINDAGQVHTYLIYLSRLPYEEQLYWKSYNEPPKGPISKRALATDFEGQWDEEYSPLNSLKAFVRELLKKPVSWWKLRSDDLIDRVHYPVTDSAEEWANEILALDQLLVEGLVEKWLRRKAEDMGRSPDLQFRSLKLVEECLIALGFGENHARSITSPLREVHNLRSKLKGHASGDEAKAIRQKALDEHGSYKQHFRMLCEMCDMAIRDIATAFKDF